MVPSGTLAFRETCQALTCRESWRVFFEESPEAMLVVDPAEARILCANDSACRYLGYASEDIAGRFLSAIIDMPEGEPPDAVRDWFTGGFREDRRLTTVFRRANGTMRGTRVVQRQFTAGDRRYSLLSLSSLHRQDIDEPAEKYRAVFENANDAFLMVGDETILDANRKAFELFGFADRNALVGKTLAELSPQFFGNNRAAEVVTLARRGFPQHFRWTHVCPDGAAIIAETGVTTVGAGRNAPVLVVIRDVTWRVQMEHVLRENERRFSSIVDEAPFGAHLYRLMPDGKLLFVGANRAADRILGVDNQQFIGKSIEEAFPALEKTAIPESYRRVARTGIVYSGQEIRYSERGISGIFEVHAYRTGPGRIAVFFADITERKKVEAALRQNEARLRNIVNNFPVILYELTPQGIFTLSEGRHLRSIGLAPGQAVGHSVFELYKNYPGITAAMKEVLSGSSSHVVLDFDGRICDAWHTFTRDAGGAISSIIGVAMDITDRKKAEEEVRRREQEYRRLIETANEGVWVLDADYNTVFVNRKMAEMFGYTPEEMRGRNATFFMTPEELENHAVRVAERRRGIKGNYERKFLRKDGSESWTLVSATPLIEPGGRFNGSFAMLTDITQRKQAEEALRQSEERYRRVVETSPDGIMFTDLRARILLANSQTARLHGYDRPEEIIGMSAFDLIAPEDRPRAERNMRGTLKNKLENNMEYSFLRKDGTRFPGELSASVVPGNRGEIIGFVAVTRDTTERNRDREQLRDSYARLQKMTGDIIASISRLVEMRDPYTAGHQRRVAQLAFAMARELGLPEEQARGIRIAGLIHDIGKIHVPSEILSKPGRLSAVEFEVVKIHPQAGYDVLRFIDFPWPVAEVAYQHQERLDGSGYPRGLKGNEILFETRIVSVADTVEAMTFHRPYRAEIGLEKALNEIEKKKGLCYDPRAVDACLDLFRNRGFVFEQ